MRILHVIPVFSPPRLLGGSQRVAYLLSKGLVQKGHEVVIYTSDMKNLKERIGKFTEEINGVSVVHFKNVSLFLSSKTMLIITLGMIKSLEMDMKNFDVIHLHEARSFQDVAVWRIALKKKVPYIVQPHGNVSKHFGGFSRKIYDELFGKRVLRDASKVIVASRAEALDCMRFGVNSKKIEVIPNPIDIEEFNNPTIKGTFKQKYDIKSNSKVILFMGRIHPIKGVDILIHAFNNLMKVSKVNATLVVSGPDDGYMAKCVKMVATYKLKNVIFTGQLEDKERICAYYDADVLVLPSRYESFSMTVLEAYASGKPVVTSRVGGLKDLVINRKTGLLVEPENMSELSEALSSMLSNKEKAEKMGLVAKEFVKNFAVERIIDRWERLYQKLMFYS